MKPSKPAKRFGVKLHVREGKGEGHWLHVRVNGVDYEFHYTGGSLNNGNHEAYVGDGENILDVELHHADDRYGIDSGGFDLLSGSSSVHRGFLGCVGICCMFARVVGHDGLRYVTMLGFVADIEL